ncbi:MAG TPA: hypothetical protein VH061_02140 [Solirubrobacteraceae bacterium]|jgi:hypothetical protein|nr:hypothetical protein [Solirubrobacteraceae bacterium]
MRLTNGRLPASLALAGACAVLGAPAALATSSGAQTQAATTKGVEYLRTLQQPNGEIAGFGGDWSLTSFAAAGIAAATIKQSESGIDARTWYRELIADPATWPGGEEPPVTEYERASLVIDAAGVDPARVSKEQNLIAQIVAHYQPANPGYYGTPALFNGTVFGMLALEGAKTKKGTQRIPQALLDKSIEVVRDNQHTNGGWTFQQVEGNEKAIKSASEPDMTGAAMAALCGAGVPSGDPTIVKGEEYLKSTLVANSGAFSVSFGANTDSNAWAVQGLNACGIDPQGTQFTTNAGKTPIDFLISQQLPGGAFRYLPSESAANEYASQDAVRALAGGSFDPQPAKGKKVKPWLEEENFDPTPGVDGLLTLVIDDGTTALDPCEVRIAPDATKTKLGKVLEAAETSASPAGCVSSFTAVKGKGAITQVNGFPEPAEARWQVSIDGGAEKAAKANAAIGLGSTIYLHIG